MYNHHRISRKPADSYSDSYTGRTPKNISSIPDSEFKIYEHEDTPPSKSNTIQDWNTQKSLGGMESRTNSTALYTAEKSNIDYFTLPGVCKRTGCSIVELIVWAIRQLIDNGVDFSKVIIMIIYIQMKPGYTSRQNMILIQIN